jgi:phospholipase A1
MPNTLLLKALLATGSLAAACASAADPSNCATIVDDTARLACYDTAFGRPAAAPAANAPAPNEKAEPQATARPAAEPRSIIGERWSRYDPPTGYPFLVRLHDANYLIIRHSDRVNTAPVSPTHPTSEPADIQRDELKFQVSVKARFWQTSDRFYSAWLGYTQQSNWQALNAALSRPFRESDYEPELMFVAQPDMPLGAGFRWQLLNLGLVHQSNGRSDPLSRSWNRVYAQFGVERDDVAGGKLAILARPWVRLHEPAGKDDNPDITDYLGYGDLALVWRGERQTFTLTGRLNPRTGKGAAKVEWSTPAIGPFRFYLQAFTGYGESLIDYNFRQTTIGAGFSLNDLF